MQGFQSTLAGGVVAAAPAGASLIAVGLAQPRDERMVLEWPSRIDPSRSLQDVVDEAAHGSVIRIRPGTHQIEPIWVRNKDVTFEGGGTDGPGARNWYDRRRTLAIQSLRPTLRSAP